VVLGCAAVLVLSLGVLVTLHRGLDDQLVLRGEA
jgi:hypothetical protein